MSIFTNGISTISVLMGLFMCVFVDWGRENLLSDINSDITTQVSTV